MSPLARNQPVDEVVLEAVVFCEAFDALPAWGPLVHHHNDRPGNAPPWCLLPLLGKPLLQWTLDALALGGVNQVFVFCRQGVEQVRSYLSAETCNLLPEASMSVTVIPTTALTRGDILREVDGRAILKTKTGGGSDIGTFVLVQCGYVGNLDLSLAAQRFSAQRKASAGLLCLASIMESRRDRAHSSVPTSMYFLDSDSRLRHYQGSTHKYPSMKRIHVPTDLFQQPQDIVMRSDLEPVGVDLCSVEVPQLFTENFDYQELRPDFVHGILNSDLLGKTIRCEVVQESLNLGSGIKWAALVGDVKSFDRVSKNVLARRTPPLLLDQPRLGSSWFFSQRPGNVYIASDVHLATKCTIERGTCLDRGSSVSDDCLISWSYIGPSVRIEPHAHIYNSHIFANVHIGSRCRIGNSVIGSGTVVEDGCTIEGGCLVGSSLVIRQGLHLKGVTVSIAGPEGSTKLQGSSGVVWPSAQDLTHRSTSLGAGSESESDSEPQDARNLTFARLGTLPYDSGFSSAASSSSSLSSLPSLASSQSSHIQSFSAIGEIAVTTDFTAECMRSLERAFVEDHTVENASIELKTLRMASNAPQAQFQLIVLEQVCEFVYRDPRKLIKWGQLVKGLLGCEEELDGMVELLLNLQKWCSEHLEHDKVKFFFKILQYFYNEDMVTEQGITKWFKSSQSKVVGGAEGLKVREVGGKMLQMLMDADDSDDD